MKEKCKVKYFFLRFCPQGFCKFQCGVDFFIHLVKNTPIIYFKKRPDFKNAVLKDKAWKAIGEKCKMTGKNDIHLVIEHKFHINSQDKSDDNSWHPYADMLPVPLKNGSTRKV